MEVGHQRHLGGEVRRSVWVATPCKTFSPLRNNPPGPRPLRSLEKPHGTAGGGVNSGGSQAAEGSQCLGGAELHGTSSSTTIGCYLWKIPPAIKWLDDHLIKTIHFDQCRFGAETTKPTTLASYLLDLSEANDLRCDHSVQEFISHNGKTYRAKHESLVQRWRVSPFLETRNGHPRR